MWRCPKCGETVDDSLDACWSCGTSADGTEDPNFQPEPDATPVSEDRLRLDGSVVFLFFRWGGTLIIGLLGLLGTLFVLPEADAWLLMSVPITIAGVSGAWVAMRLYMTIYKDKRIETELSTKSDE